MNKKLCFSVIALTAFAFHLSIAQAPNWTIWNASNSVLGSDRVYYVETNQQTAVKYFGTFAHGLFQLSNITWTSYTTSNSNIPSNAIKECRLDNLGGLWIATQDAGISYLLNGVFTNYDVSNSGLNDNESWAITPDNNGGVWIGNGAYGLCHFDGTNWVYYTAWNSGLPNNWVNSIEIDNSGAIWVATGGGGVARLSAGQWTTWNSQSGTFPHNYCYFIFKSSLGEIWAGSQGGVSRYDGQNWITYNSTSSFSGGSCSSITEDAQGKMWFGSTMGGVYAYDGSNWQNFNMSNSTLPSNYIESVDLSPFDHVWVGTYDGGLAGIKEDSLVQVNTLAPMRAGITLYPTVAADQISIQSPESAHFPLEYVVLNVNGQVMMNGSIQQPTERLALHDFPSGTYFFKVIDEIEPMRVQKFMVGR